MILMDSAQFPGIPLEVYFFLRVFIEIFKFKIFPRIKLLYFLMPLAKA